MTSSKAELRPQPRPGILDIAAYVPGKSGAKGKKIHKLSSNESPLGASPAAMAAFRDAAGKLELYPDGSATALREAIAARYGLNRRCHRLRRGLGRIAAAHCACLSGPRRRGDLFGSIGFLVYPIAIKSNGATAVVAPERNHTADVDAMLARVTPRTRIVFLANPNNPTGTYLPFSEVKRLHAGLPRDVLLVLDAAYAEYVRRNDYESGIELVSTSNNVVMTRTFSKIYGLAALRLGWAYCPPMWPMC